MGSSRYYSQHSVEELTTPLAAKTTALAYFIETLKEKHQIQIDEQTAFAFLGGFGLQGRLASSLPIAQLSGGQKVIQFLLRDGMSY